MPAKWELSMRQMRNLLRLHRDGVSALEIGRLLGVARSTIQDSWKRAAAARLRLPLPDDATDDALERLLFGRTGAAPGQRRRTEPDCAQLAREAEQEWSVLWRDHHAGYITWREYEANQKLLLENAHMKKNCARKSARGGRALLTGLMRCGRYGRMMRVFYGMGKGHAHRYQCRTRPTAMTRAPSPRSCEPAGSRRSM